MKNFPMLLVIGVAAPALCVAGADLKTAVQKFAEKSSYSWTAASSGKPEFRLGPMEGKAEKDGFVYCKFTLGDNPIEMAFKGSKFAIKRGEQWESAEDLASNNGAGIARRLKAFKPPAAEAQDLLQKSKELKVGGDGLYSGDLTAEGVKELFSRTRPNAQVSEPKGTVKFWVKDGLLIKYEFEVQGKISVNGEENDIQRTTTVEIKDVDASKVSVPEEAKTKLS